MRKKSSNGSVYDLAMSVYESISQQENGLTKTESVALKLSQSIILAIEFSREIGKVMLQSVGSVLALLAIKDSDGNPLWRTNAVEEQDKPAISVDDDKV